MKNKLLFNSFYKKFNSNLFNFNKKFICQGAYLQKDTNQVKLRGKFLKCRNPDMPTLVWLPEMLENVENFEKFFTDPDNKVLDYRNVWLLNPRNFGNSDHHHSLDMDEVVEDIRRFIDENQLSIVTIGGHGYGAKIACAFGTTYLDRTSGVMCLEGGPVDIRYHNVWHEIKDVVNSAYNLSKTCNNTNEFLKKIDLHVKHPIWNKIIKANLIESSSGLSFNFNIDAVYKDVNRLNPRLAMFDSVFGLFPGRAFVQFASHSHHILLNTQTIPIYNFFPKLEGRFGTIDLNIIQTDEDPSNHWMHYNLDREGKVTLMSRFSNWLKHKDGVHVLLSDRSEIGWYAIPERTGINKDIAFATEYTPEHVHHNWKHTNVYTESKKLRNVKSANIGEFSKGLSNPKYF